MCGRHGASGAEPRVCDKLFGVRGRCVGGEVARWCWRTVYVVRNNYILLKRGELEEQVVLREVERFPVFDAFEKVIPGHHGLSPVVGTVVMSNFNRHHATWTSHRAKV